MKTIDTDSALLTNVTDQEDTLAAAFNERSRDVSEIEIKYLVSDNASNAFENIEQFFSDKGLIIAQQKDIHLLSRQLDTPSQTLLKQGTTLRVRGNCKSGNLNNVTAPDICLKTGKTQDDSGALRRGEYETRIDHFEKLDIPSLLNHYPENQYPELHEALNSIDEQDIKEHFRIDCIRHRYVIDIPENETGIYDKRFVAELMLDDIAFILDLPDLDKPVLFHSEREIECEALFHACEYDTSPDAHKHISSPDVTDRELNQAMGVFSNFLKDTLENDLTLALEGKAERGFEKLEGFLSSIEQYIQKHSPVPDNDNLKGVFLFNAQETNATEQENTSAASSALSLVEPPRTIALRI